MRRITFSLVLFFLIIAFPISADTDWESYTNLYMYTIPGPSFYVDLSNGVHIYDGAHGGNWSEAESDSTYGDIDIVGILGVADIDKSDNKTVFTEGNKFSITCDRIGVSANDETWVYASQSNPNIQFPFGLDFVLRANTWGKTDGSTVNKFGNNGVVHLGYGSDGNNIFPDITVDPEWAAFWLDIVLVIPSEEEVKASGINYGAASDFQVELQLTLTDDQFGICKTFSLLLRGYYDTAVTDSSNSYIIFSVNPTNANIIPLSSLNGADYSIGTYFYETTPIQSSSNETSFANSNNIKSPIHMFVSASNSLSSKGVKFNLKHEKASISNNALAVNIPFSIGLQSHSGGNIEWYDGDEYIQEGELKNFDNHNNPILGQYEYSSTRLGLQDIVILHDDGEILFKLGHYGENFDSEYVKNTFVSGKYNSNIYIHLYSAL